MKDNKQESIIIIIIDPKYTQINLRAKI